MHHDILLTKRLAKITLLLLLSRLASLFVMLLSIFLHFQFSGRENFCSIHVSLVPQPKATGEHKTKPTQASVRELRGLGT